MDSVVFSGSLALFIINGLVKGAIQRVPRKGSFVSNLAQGGKAIGTKLNYKELKISKIVAKYLKKSKAVTGAMYLFQKSKLLMQLMM